MQVMMFPASFQATRVSRNRFLCSSQTMFVLLRLAARLSDRATRKVRQEDPQVRSTRAGHRRRRIAAAANGHECLGPGRAARFAGSR